MSLHTNALSAACGDSRADLARDAVRAYRQFARGRDAEARKSQRLPLSLQLRCRNWHRGPHAPAYRAVLLAERLSRPGHATSYQFFLAWSHAFAALGLQHMADLNARLAQATRREPEPYVRRVVQP